MLRGISSRWLATLTTMLSGYVLMPFLVTYLGQDGYGTWALVGSMTSVVGLLMLGAPLASLRYLSKAIATGDREEINRVVGSSLGLYLIMAAGAILIGTVLFAFFARYPVTPPLRSTAYRAYAVAVVACALGFLSRLPMGILSAHEDFALQSRVTISADVARVVSTILLLKWGGSLTSVALGQLIAVGVEQSLFVMIIRRRYPNLQVRLSEFRVASVHSMLTFSMPVMLIGVGGYLSFQTDPLVIGAVMAVAEIPFYVVGSRLIGILLAFSAAMAAVVTPAATKMHARGEDAALSILLLKWGRFSFCLAVVALTGLIVVGPDFVAWWIGPAFRKPTALVLGILAIGHLALLPAQSVAYPVLVATGRLTSASIGFVAAGVSNVVLSLIFGRWLGLAGIALGTALPTVAYAILLQRLACLEAGVAVRDYLRYVVFKPMLRIGPPAVLVWWASSGHGLRGYPAALVGLTGLVGLLVIGILLMRDLRYGRPE